MTYEGAYSIMGPFLKDLGATALEVGIIAGVGEMIAASLRFFSGRLADRTRAYWPIAIFGLCDEPGGRAGAGVRRKLAGGRVPDRRRADRQERCAAQRATCCSPRRPRKSAMDWGFGLHAAMDQTGAVAGPLLMVAVGRARPDTSGPAFLRLGDSRGARAARADRRARACTRAKGTPPKPPTPRRRCRPCSGRTSPPRACSRCGFLDFPLLAFHFEKTQHHRAGDHPAALRRRDGE